MALMIVAMVAGVVLLIVFLNLSAMDLSPPDAKAATLLFLSYPASFVLFAPYGEGVFLLLTALSLIWARGGRSWLAGFAAFLAVLTRQQGLLLAFPLMAELWERHDRDLRRLIHDWSSWLSLALVPAGLGFWLLRRAFYVGGVYLDASTPYSLVRSLLIPPDASKVGAVHMIMPPWRALHLAIARFWVDPDLDLLVNLLMALGFTVITVLAWPHLRLAYRVYVVTIVLVSLSYHTGTTHPYMGLSRHLYLAFPVFIGLARVLRRSWHRLLYVFVGSLGACFLTLLYVTEAWVP